MQSTGLIALVVPMILSLFLSHFTLAGNKSPHVSEFNTLCRIYLIALNGAELDAEKIISTNLPVKDETTANEKIKDYIDQTNPNRTDYESREEGWKAQNPRLQTSTPTRIAYRKLTRIQESLQKVKKEIEEVRQQIKGEVSQSITFFNQIRTEDGKLEGYPGVQLSVTGTATRAARCVGAANEAGQSIMKDLLCLCANGVAGAQACGFANAASAWNPTSADEGTSHTNANWGAIKTECLKQKEFVDASPHNISLALNNFEALLGRQAGTVTTGSNAQHMLGGGYNSPSCDGSTDDANLCVSYKKNAGRVTISWMQSLLQAREHLKRVDQLLQRGKWDQERLLAAVNTAQLVFVEAETALEESKANPEAKALAEDKKQTPDTSSNKATAQESNTAMSNAVIPRLFLPWMFLV